MTEKRALCIPVVSVALRLLSEELQKKSHPDNLATRYHCLFKAVEPLISEDAQSGYLLLKSLTTTQSSRRHMRRVIRNTENFLARLAA